MLTNPEKAEKTFSIVAKKKKFSFSFCLSAAKIENMKLNLLFNIIYDAQDSIHVYAQLN